MSEASFTVFVGCIGRPSLERTVRSFREQTDLRDTDRLVLIMNPDEGDVELARSLIDDSPAVRLCLCDRREYFNKMNWAVHRVPIETTHVLPMIGDDDILMRRSFEVLRQICTADPTRIVLGRFLPAWRILLWDCPRMQISRVSGQSIVVPVQCWGIPFGTRDYLEVDYDWMTQVLVKAEYLRGANDPLWLDQLLCVSTPDKYTDAIGLK